MAHGLHYWVDGAKVRAAIICILVGGAMLLSGCVGALTWNPERLNQPPPGGHYIVHRGDTLFSIAFHYGIDYHDLAAWNAINAPYFIYPGERLQLAPQEHGRDAIAATTHAYRKPPPAQAAPVSKTAAAPSHSPMLWTWPVHGRLLSTFEQNSTLAKGIDIGGSMGDAIHAAASGKVVYTGSGLIGYGKLIIIKHDEHYLSAYAHNKQVFVTQGDEVEKGDRIASMGANRDNRAMLHFEIRHDGNPVNPLRYLPHDPSR